MANYTPKKLYDSIIRNGVITQQDYALMAGMSKHKDCREYVRKIADAIVAGKIQESMMGDRRMS